MGRPSSHLADLPNGTALPRFDGAAEVPRCRRVPTITRARSRRSCSLRSGGLVDGMEEGNGMEGRI